MNNKLVHDFEIMQVYYPVSLRIMYINPIFILLTAVLKKLAVDLILYHYMSADECFNDTCKKKTDEKYFTESST